VPELPEVETIRAHLAPRVEGRRFERVSILDPRLTRPHDPREVMVELDGEEVAALERRGKYLVVRFRTDRSLLIHLRMTGSLHYAPAGTLESDPYRRAVVTLDNRSDVAYRDVRRFGTWLLLEPGELEPYLAVKNGPEPLSRRFTTTFLAERLSRRTAPLKAALLDQRTVAGLGNIYVDEALWQARLHPRRPAGSLKADELRAAHRGVRRALERGIARQGATLRDYRTPDGGSGSMQDEFNVYGREGEPCPRCGTPIEKTRAGGRGTWFCPACQRL
jgi:formamidopyrimidine-DNA glycosylase